jgi:hypothetical protein
VTTPNSATGPALDGKRALVTGAASGIERACAHRLGRSSPLTWPPSLCGPEAGFITGTSMVLDGGWTAR